MALELSWPLGLSIADEQGAQVPQAWLVLSRRHARAVELALVADGWSITEARDHAQEAWLRVIEQARQGLLTRIELPGLVIQQARFLAIDARRADRRRLDVHASVGELQHHEAGPEAQVVARADLRRARQVLASCHRSAQRVFELRYGEPPLDTAEIAAQLGLSVQRVRQIVCEVRALLREALGEERR